ncbi:hypothetical protein E5288_WYG007122 [Bos mutus]|uniref:Uncharacterized protein n=1 Tax=Bos mutus TaxID=72004 RepID=A0A6B0QVX7_9CETA|nr:hypothetical protein [Bos mutus]
MPCTARYMSSFGELASKSSRELDEPFLAQWFTPPRPLLPFFWEERSHSAKETTGLSLTSIQAQGYFLMTSCCGDSPCRQVSTGSGSPLAVERGPVVPPLLSDLSSETLMGIMLGQVHLSL